MEQVFCKRKHDAIAVGPEQRPLVQDISPERKRLRASVGVQSQTPPPIAVKPVPSLTAAPPVIEEQSGKKRKGVDDFVSAKRIREIDVLPTKLSENGGKNDDDDYDDEEEDVLPKFRVIDMPLSLRAHAYLQEAKNKASADQGSNAGVLVLYSPRPSVCQAPVSAVVSAGQTDEDIKMAQSRLPSPSPSTTMDVD
ncbi:hypothetical protein IW150_001015 [Coemansia sp. RSA 2607]|nr:hypothetical protein IW150_001015 [Coemansia sp. RSA 2607]